MPSDVDLSQLIQEIAALENGASQYQLSVWRRMVWKYWQAYICLVNPNLLAETQIVLRQSFGLWHSRVTIQTDESLQIKNIVL